MKILLTGNMGYLGPVVAQRLRESFPDASLVGFDMGYFANYASSVVFPESWLDVQYFGDVRTIPPAVLHGVDAVIHLAAISNDPMGATFEDVTFEVNHRASVEVAQKAKSAGVKTFVFASSCSVYGVAAGGERTETDPVSPLTAYAKSKIRTEQELSRLADKSFSVTCLRFATACGMSSRLRLDLVLNDFVASAMACGRIDILSDGTPWRPLIHVRDMARILEWAIRREGEGERFLVMNAGSDEWNYQVKELAEAVARVIPGIEVTVNRHAQPDKRSYRVSFDRLRRYAPAFMPRIDLRSAIEDLVNGLRSIGFRDQAFRNSNVYIRLNALRHLKHTGLLTEGLEWTHRQILVRV